MQEHWTIFYNLRKPCKCWPVRMLWLWPACAIHTLHAVQFIVLFYQTLHCVHYVCTLDILQASCITCVTFGWKLPLTHGCFLNQYLFLAQTAHIAITLASSRRVFLLNQFQQNSEYKWLTTGVSDKNFGEIAPRVPPQQCKTFFGESKNAMWPFSLLTAQISTIFETTDVNWFPSGDRHENVPNFCAAKMQFWGCGRGACT